MGRNSRIEWTEHTFNPWIGCAKISEGCQHCYAENDIYPRVQRSRGLELWGPRAVRKPVSESSWQQPERWNRAAAEAGQTERVFCGSECDVFEDRGDLDRHRARLFSLIDRTPSLEWLLLTKRPQSAQLLPNRWMGGYPPNVWIGTSVETQRWANKRIPYLLGVPASVRFLSVEPLLERISLAQHLSLRAAGRPGIDWVIVGGESGPKARPLDVDHMRALITECRTVGVPVFVKQLGTVWERDYLGTHGSGGEWDWWPLDLRIRELPRSSGPGGLR
jgi:protein gp37